MRFSTLLFFLASRLTNAALVSAPNNIVCFPERDFCSIENFQEYTGKPLTVEVFRNGAIVGATKGIVSGGDAAFEINHPGALCWGEGVGANLQVTPDIQPGDLITVKSGELLLGDSIIQNAYITGYELVGSTVRIKGFVAQNVIHANMEVRIVNPLFRDTGILTKKQVNAAFGPLIQDQGFQSGLEVDGTTFTATFIFTSQQAADIAGSGGEMSLRIWQATTPLGERQGLTISAFGEVGGPWSSICPAGPQNLLAPIPTAIAVSGTLIKWLPGQDVFGAPATTHFSVNVLRGNQVYGYRLPKTDNQVAFALTPLAGGDVVEIRSMIGSKMSDPLSITYQPTPPNNPLPTLASIPAANANTDVKTDLIILDATNTDQIVYTIDGSAVLDANNNISPAAILYHAPIDVPKGSKPFTLRAVSFDRAGRISTQLVGKFAPVDIALPQAITVAPKTVVQNGGVTLSWTKPNDASITGYGVEVFEQQRQGAIIVDVKIGVTRLIAGTTLHIKDLLVGRSYKFSVLTQNAGGSSAASPKTAAIVFPKPTDTINLVEARYRLNTQFRVRGTLSGTTPDGRTVTLHSVKTDGSIGPIIIRRTPATAIPAQAVVCGGVPIVCSFTVDLRNAAVPAANPGKIYAKSSGGGVHGPFTVA